MVRRQKMSEVSSSQAVEDGSEPRALSEAELKEASEQLSRFDKSQQVSAAIVFYRLCRTMKIARTKLYCYYKYDPYVS